MILIRAEKNEEDRCSVYCILCIDTIGLKQISQRLRSFTVKSACFFFVFFFRSFFFCYHSISPKFPLRSADTLRPPPPPPPPPTHTHTNTHSQRSCRLLTDVWRESWKVLSQTNICRLLVCTESVQNRRYACDNENLARIPRHGTAQYRVPSIYSMCRGCRCVPRVGYRSVPLAPALPPPPPPPPPSHTQHTSDTSKNVKTRYKRL